MESRRLAGRYPPVGRTYTLSAATSASTFTHQSLPVSLGDIPGVGSDAWEEPIRKPNSGSTAVIAIGNSGLDMSRALSPHHDVRVMEDALFGGKKLVPSSEGFAFWLTLLCAFMVCGSTHGRTLHVSHTPLLLVGANTQFLTIGAAAEAVVAGDRVLIHAGVYRESVVIEASGSKEHPILFEAVQAASVIVTGADCIEDWKKADADSPDNIGVTDWPYRFIAYNKTMAHPDDDEHSLIGRAEQVFVDGYALQQVLRRGQMARGTFFADTKNKKLFVWLSNNARLADDPDSAPQIEASVRGEIWQVLGDHVITRGIRFRYAANQAQRGAAQFSGRGDTVEDCIFERMNSSGALFSGPDQVVKRCTFQDNGQIGFSAVRAHQLQFGHCLVRNNNTKNFNRGWEAGGNKIVLTRGAVLANSRFIENRGNGIWFDIGNEDSTVRNCLIADNEDAGIFYEISYGLHAHDNVILGNGLSSRPGAWGAAAGIALSSSPGCVIERNLIVGNKEGFAFREQERTTPKIGDVDETPEHAIWNHDEVIRNNILAHNRDAQVWGWFDIDDERHWPATMQMKHTNVNVPRDRAISYRGKEDKSPQTDLSLERLNITFENNLYAADETQGVFNWGTTWRRNKEYTSLEDVRRELNCEPGSILVPLELPGYMNRDFTLPVESPAFRLHAYPRGTVPGVELGVVE